MKGQFMLISAFVMSIIVLSAASTISNTADISFDNSGISYTIEEIRQEAEKVDFSEEKQRDNFESRIEEIPGYSVSMEYSEVNNCANVTLVSQNEFHELNCLN